MSSRHYTLGETLNLVVLNEPKSIMDVGCGYGMMGFLARVYLEYTPYKPETWKLTIDGVEGFPEYIAPMQKYYTNVKFEDINTAYRYIYDYDLILFLSTIEHLDKEKGHEILKTFIRRNKAVIVTVPNGFHKTRAIYHDNPYMSHLSGWTRKEFHQLGLKTRMTSQEHQIIAYSPSLRTTPPLRRKIPGFIRHRLLKWRNPDKYYGFYPGEKKEGSCAAADRLDETGLQSPSLPLKEK